MSALSKLLKPRGITELGKIKIGRKGKERSSARGNKFRPPEKLDHFVVTTMERDADGDFKPDEVLMQELVDAGYGDEDGKLRSIPIYLMSNDIDDCMQSRWCWYPGKTLGASSDGETVKWFLDRKTKRKLPRVVEEPWDDSLEEFGFKLHSIFSCVIAAKSARYGGVYKFRTTSRISSEQTYSSLMSIQQLTLGVLQGLPLTLVLRPMQVSPDGKASTVYVTHVEMRGGDLKAIQERALQLAQLRTQNARAIQGTEAEYRRLLQAPGDEFESAEDSADAATEFHPEVFIDGDTEAAGQSMDAAADEVSGLDAFRDALATCKTSAATKAVFDVWLGQHSPLTESEQVAAGAEYQKQYDEQVAAEAEKTPPASTVVKKIAAAPTSAELHRLILKATQYAKDGKYTDDELGMMNKAAEARDEELLLAS